MPRSARLSSGLSGDSLSALPVLDVDAVDEQVRIEVRLADEGEDLAVPRIDRDERAAPVAEQLLDHRLQADVDRQHERVAGRRRVALQAPHRVAAGAHLDLLEAGRAVQLALVALLDAELADVFGAAVVGQVVVGPVVLHLLLLGRVDAADVADQVAADLAERIAAKEPRLDLDAVEAEALRREARDLLVGEAGADRQRLDAACFPRAGA